MGINLQEVSSGYVKLSQYIIHKGFRHTDTHKPVQWTVILNMQATSNVQPLIVEHKVLLSDALTVIIVFLQ